MFFYNLIPSGKKPTQASRTVTVTVEESKLHLDLLTTQIEQGKMQIEPCAFQDDPYTYPDCIMDETISNQALPENNT